MHMLSIKENKGKDQDDGHWIGPAPHIQGTLPGPNAKAIIQQDQQFTSPSNTRDYPLVARRGSGSVVEDVDGNRFLDLAAGIAVCATGHCHPKVTEAIKTQAERLIHICGSDFYYEPMATLCAQLSEMAPGKADKRVLLTNSGTEAVEAAIKLARFHTKRKWVIAFHGSFHGRTMGSLSLTCSKARQQIAFHPLVPMVAHVPYNDTGAIENQLFKYKMAPDEVAAIFVEPLQGEGGYIVPDAEFLPSLRRLCDQHGILLVCDEIQSGIGRTGKWWACDHTQTVPDILLSAKGLASGMPLGAVVARADVMDWPQGAQGSTFGGNPICCAAALATIDLVKSQYLANVQKLADPLMVALNELAVRHKCITEPRGLGLMCAVDVVGPRTGKPDPALRLRILQAAFERGVILLPCGECGIRFCPPLCINETQLEVGLRILSETIATLA